MSELHALLIGIDAYLPNRLPKGWYPQLAGCVNDVKRVEEFLRSRYQLAPERLHKLTASVSENGSTDPVEPKEEWPTYENIVAAFQRLAATASPGDPVYIHYSGHGNRATTAYPEIKGPQGLDEVLVPADIGNSEARYLRDVELAHYLRMLVDHGLLVTLVLDSCHSAGATRTKIDDQLPRQRGVNWIDTSPRRTDSLVGSKEELLASWPLPPAKGGNTRDFLPSTGWLPDPEGYTLIAACTSQQSANEGSFEGDESSGALTHFLLAALAESEAGMTYETLHNRLLARVQSQFPNQTPVIVGERQRPVLGSEPRAAREVGSPRRPQGVIVLGSDEKGRLRLNTGQAHGVLDGARFAIYPPDADLAAPGEPLAEVEVVQYGGVESLAEVKGALPASPIPPGSRALLLDPGLHYGRTAVRMVYRSSPSDEEKKVLGAIATLIGRSPYLELAEGGTAADLQVALDDLRRITIQDSTGTPVPHLGSSLTPQTRNAADTTVGRLVHLAKYHAVRQLVNPKAPPELAGKLTVELLGIQDLYDTKERPNPRPGTGGEKAEMREEQWTFLRIANRSTSALSIALLDLQPDWGITQIFPGDSEESLVTLDPGENFDLPLQAKLPQGIYTGTDVLKVFATLGAADFRFLELPALYDSQQRTLAAVMPSRHPEWLGIPHADWLTAQVEVTVQSKWR